MLAQMQPIDRSLFFSRQDPQDPRLGETAATTGEASAELCLLGYPDDEGIRLNGGREGARQGPTEIRRWLYKMTPHPHRRLKSFCDLGDLKLGGDLGARHEQGAEVVGAQLAKNRQVLSFGGGNDYAYADGIAFLKHYREQRPIVINVDAHLDVRPVERGLNSGTPFYRLLESGIPFDFVEFGIQLQCNARAHLDYVRDKGGLIVNMEDYFASGVSLLEFATRALGERLLRYRPCFLAIDIDAFALAYAPGASSSWPLGLAPAEFYTLYLTWLKRFDVRVLGIYETSPPLDVSAATVKWAAQLAHGYLHES